MGPSVDVGKNRGNCCSGSEKSLDICCWIAQKFVGSLEMFLHYGKVSVL